MCIYIYMDLLRFNSHFLSHIYMYARVHYTCKYVGRLCYGERQLLLVPLSFLSHFKSAKPVNTLSLIAYPRSVPFEPRELTLNRVD